MNRLVALLLFTLVTYSHYCAAEPKIVPRSLGEANSSRYLELGISGGTPAGFNLCLGYWLGKPRYLLARISGMHFGSELNGFQLEVGKTFYRTSFMKALYSYSLRYTHQMAGLRTVEFFGPGANLGINMRGFSIDLGIAIGKGNNTTFFPFLKDAEAGSRLTFQLQFQIGYKVLFYQ
jgi:hypothetical protein